MASKGSKRKASEPPLRASPFKKVATAISSTIDVAANAASDVADAATSLVVGTNDSNNNVNPVAPHEAYQPDKPEQASPTPPKSPPSIPQNGSAPAEFDHSRIAETLGLVQRAFYPPEMSSERCEQYNRNELPRPIELLEQAIKDTASAREAIPVGDAVIHWFKRDLRTQDNHALSLASAKAKTKGVPLICLFIVSPQDYQAHLTSAPRVDFELRTLAVLKEDLAQLDIPLYVETQEKRKEIPARVLELCEEWGVKHIYCNIEYEVDELRRETEMTRQCLEKGISFTTVHDDVIVPPGALHTGTGKQYSVYSPWFRSWLTHLHSNPRMLDPFASPIQNPTSIRHTHKHLFHHPIPTAPLKKSLTPEEKPRFTSLWPAGEHEAHDRLSRFLSERISKYKDERNLPGANSTAVLSVHFSSGTLAARTAVRQARDVNSTKKLDGGNPGIVGWISEIAWRDFYKHVLAHWPYVCMNKPFKHEYAHIDWSYDMHLFELWCKGQTGFPIVDAAMRQLLHTGYMHNRCRMIVASFLCKDLLLDWRLGERHFMLHLIDGDFASNNGGWGFSASSGVDPQPYFRIFNPLLQSEKFDSEGVYIRKWVEELRGVKGKAVHEPYGGKGKDGEDARREAEAKWYPRPCVVHREMREKALEMYKKGIGRETANELPVKKYW